MCSGGSLARFRAGSRKLGHDAKNGINILLLFFYFLMIQVNGDYLYEWANIIY